MSLDYLVYTYILKAGGVYMQDKIYNLVKQFELRIIKKIPYKDYHIVSTDRGIFSLKKVDCTICEILFIHNAKEYLIKNGFKHIDRYITANGAPYVELDKDYYVMTRFIKGRKCKFTNLTEMEKAFMTLASLHKASKGYDFERKNKIRSNIGKLQEEYLERCQDFIYMKSLAQMRSQKKRIDFLFLKNVDRIYDMAIKSVVMLQNNGYFEFCEEMARENYLCHNDYNHNNIIIDKFGQFNIINFDYCKFELRCVDISNLIADAMDRVNWDFKSTLKILNAYNDVKAIEEREYKLMISFLQFPQDIWKIATEYYYQDYDYFQKAYYIKLKDKIEKIPYKIEFLKKFKKKFL